MKTIHQRINFLTKRIWNPKVFNYDYNFKKAIKRSLKLDLVKPDEIVMNTNVIYNTSEGRQYITNEILEELYERNNLRVTDLSLKCFYINNELKKFLKLRFDIHSTLTIGNVYASRLQINFEKYSDLKKRLSDKGKPRDIKFHAWLTLENMDVLDIVFPPNMYIEQMLYNKNVNEEDFKKLIWIKTKEFNENKNSLIYEPQIVGFEYINRIKIPFYTHVL